MSASAQTRRFDLAPITSGLPQSPDVLIVRWQFSKVPEAVSLELSKLFPVYRSRHAINLARIVAIAPLSFDSSHRIGGLGSLRAF